MNVDVAVLGSPSLIIPMVFVAVNNIERRTAPELWSCVRVEVAVLGSHSLDEGCGLQKVFRVAQQNVLAALLHGATAALLPP